LSFRGRAAIEKSDHCRFDEHSEEKSARCRERFARSLA
jgi:hypothetical protein